MCVANYFKRIKFDICMKQKKEWFHVIETKKAESFFRFVCLKLDIMAISLNISINQINIKSLLEISLIRIIVTIFYL